MAVPAESQNSRPLTNPCAQLLHVAWLGTNHRSRLLHITGELRDAWRIMCNASSLGLDQDQDQDQELKAS